jgi:hypothetical protein
MRLSLCLVVWNELEGCKLDVPRLPRDAFDEVFAVDGGSTDGTVSVRPLFEGPPIRTVEGRSAPPVAASL